MRRLIILFLIFLNGCGIIHIEIRDKQKKPEATQEQKQKSTYEQKPRQEVKREEKPTTLKVQSPVKGKATPTDKGYYIATSCNEFFRSVSDGRVLYAGDDIKSYGWVAMIEDSNGMVYVYGKADSLLVKRGEEIKRGQPIGKVGKSSEGCGLLFEIRDQEGRPVKFELVL